MKKNKTDEQASQLWANLTSPKLSKDFWASYDKLLEQARKKISKKKQTRQPPAKNKKYGYT